MGFFDFVKRGAEKLWSGVKTVANKVKERGSMIFSGAKKVMDFAKDSYEKLGRIPIIGETLKNGVDSVLELPIPYTKGISLKTGLKTAEQAVNVGNKIFN